jgi:uncharacterized protein
MQTYALRLKTGQDLRRELEIFVLAHQLRACFVLTCVGSLTQATLRLADADESNIFIGRFDIVSLVGTFSRDGAHLHISISDKQGKTLGGHLMYGSLIYTTAEVVLGELPGIVFRRPIDPQTGYDELTVEDLDK